MIGTSATGNFQYFIHIPGSYQPHPIFLKVLIIPLKIVRIMPAHFKYACFRSLPLQLTFLQVDGTAGINTLGNRWFIQMFASRFKK